MLKLVSFTLCCMILNSATSISAKIERFNNVVKYNFNANNNVYQFNLRISHALSMSRWNKNRFTYDPVLYNPSTKQYLARNFSYEEKCDAVNIVQNDEDLASIVTAAGVHRNMLLINQMFPGTPIVVPVNAKVEITVTNDMMSDVLSMHWHGQTQKGTFYMDGVTRVTQCPIGPGETFTYKFTATEVGTHWYHAHSGVQRTEGLYGPFIVTENLNENPAFYKEFYFIVQDWLQLDSEFVFSHVNWENAKFFPGFKNQKSCFSPKRMDDGTIVAPLPLGDEDAILINGKGWYNLPDNPKDAERLNPSIFNHPIETFEVEPNKRYLFRVIGANAGHALEIRVGGHKMTVVASDGNRIKPISDVESLIINSGERYDFYIDTKESSDMMNYFIIVRTLETKTLTYAPYKPVVYGLAILKYKSVPNTKITCSTACNPIDKNSLKVNCPFWPKNYGYYKCIGVNKYESLNVPETDKEMLHNHYDSNSFSEYF